MGVITYTVLLSGSGRVYEINVVYHYIDTMDPIRLFGEIVVWFLAFGFVTMVLTVFLSASGGFSGGVVLISMVFGAVAATLAVMSLFKIGQTKTK